MVRLINCMKPYEPKEKKQEVGTQPYRREIREKGEASVVLLLSDDGTSAKKT